MQKMLDDCDNPRKNLKTNTHLTKKENKVQVLGRGGVLALVNDKYIITKKKKKKVL